LRKRLLAEVDNLQSTDTACAWAQAALRDKNNLHAGDAQIVEDAFEQKLKGLAEETSKVLSATMPVGGPDISEATIESTARTAEARSGAEAAKDAFDQPRSIDKSVLAIPAPRRYRDREHLRFVIQQACLVCGRKPSDPHHLRHVQPKALGRKASDEFVVPLCRVHHRAAHRVGDERAWWKQLGIDPLKVAHKLWGHTRLGVPETTHLPRTSKPNDGIARDAPA
jgi:hypothetical protein